MSQVASARVVFFDLDDTGTLALLTALRARTRIGVVTNNVVDEQLEKLHVLDLRALVDVLVISEEAGVAKPDPEIFGLRSAEPAVWLRTP